MQLLSSIEQRIVIVKKTRQSQNDYTVQPTKHSSVADEILKFKNLLDIGAITQEEFGAKKKFSALPPEKLHVAKSIIALNKFKDGDFQCEDNDILTVLSYYRITRDDVEF